MTGRFLWMAFILSGAVARCHAEGRTQGRSMVISRYGIVATEHPLASQIGANVLVRGGNAVDAAVAANADKWNRCRDGSWCRGRLDQAASKVWAKKASRTAGSGDSLR